MPHRTHSHPTLIPHNSTAKPSCLLPPLPLFFPLLDLGGIVIRTVHHRSSRLLHPHPHVPIARIPDHLRRILHPDRIPGVRPTHAMPTRSRPPPATDQLTVLAAHDDAAGESRGLASVLLVHKSRGAEMVSEFGGWGGEAVADSFGGVEGWKAWGRGLAEWGWAFGDGGEGGGCDGEGGGGGLLASTGEGWEREGLAVLGADGGQRCEGVGGWCVA